MIPLPTFHEARRQIEDISLRDPSRPPEADEEVATEESAKNPEEIKSATNAELERLKVS
jgi:hypothetical protein